MAERLRVAVLAPTWFPVPPTGYGGIEWVVSLLADGLVEAGHETTLFASGDSQTNARLISVFVRSCLCSCSVRHQVPRGLVLSGVINSEPVLPLRSFEWLGRVATGRRRVLANPVLAVAPPV